MNTDIPDLIAGALGVSRGTAYDMMREALAGQQKPVAKVCHDLDGHIGWNPKLTELPDEGTLLYTSPPASKPLTKEQRIEVALKSSTVGGLIDAVEAAHGIKGDA